MNFQFCTRDTTFGWLWMHHRMGDSLYLQETMSDRIHGSTCGFHLPASGLVKYQFVVWIVSCEQKKNTIYCYLPLSACPCQKGNTAREKMTSESAPYHRDWMLQLGCSNPSHMSSTPASPNLFSPMCSTFKCLFTLRAELMALQQAVVSPHSLILQGKCDMRSRWGI